MRKLITILLIAISFNATAQKKPDATPVAKPAVDTATYALLGKADAFTLLFKALATPGDVTPNQLNALLVWIDKNRQKLN